MEHSKPGIVKRSITSAEQGVWDRSLDGVPAAVDRSRSIGFDPLALAARLGLAIFLTAGFTAALRLNDGAFPSSGISPQLSVGFFCWALGLIACVTSPAS